MTVIVVPFGTGIGDIVLQRPLLNATKRTFPGQEILVYAPRAAQRLLPDNVTAVPRILGIPAWRRIQFESAWHRLGPLEESAISFMFNRLGAVEASRMPAHLLRKSRRYEAVIDLMGAFLDAVSFERDWLPPPTGSRGPHLQQRLTSALETQGVTLSECDYTPVAIPRLDRQLAMKVRGRYPPDEYVVIHPHSGSSLKTGSAAMWAGIVEGAHQRGLVPLVTAGATGAELRFARSVAGVRGSVLPRMTLLALAGLAKGSRALVAPDTGLLSLSANVGAPWVGLFGSTNPYLIGPRETESGTALVTSFEHTRGCTACWQKFVAGSGLCAESKGPSCAAAFSLSDILDAVMNQPRTRRESAD